MLYNILILIFFFTSFSFASNCIESYEGKTSSSGVTDYIILKRGRTLTPRDVYQPFEIRSRSDFRFPPDHGYRIIRIKKSVIDNEIYTGVYMLVPRNPELPSELWKSFNLPIPPVDLPTDYKGRILHFTSKIELQDIFKYVYSEKNGLDKKKLVSYLNKYDELGIPEDVSQYVSSMVSNFLESNNNTISYEQFREVLGEALKDENHVMAVFNEAGYTDESLGIATRRQL